MIRNIMQRGSDNKEWVENCFFWGGMSFFCFSRIPVPLYLQHSEAITLVFTWHLHDFAVLMLVG